MIRRRKIILSFLFISLSIFGNAQEWHTDLIQAKAIAVEESKNIVLVFQGSDWCAPCMKLEKEIWTNDEFKAYAKDHFVMLLADFPKKKGNVLSLEQQEKNNKLAEIYNKNGFFPFVVILDKEGKVLGQTGYKKMTPDEYIKHLASF